MKYKFILMIIMVALIITSSLAQEVQTTGTVSVVKDYSGKVTAIKLIIRSYDIKIDEYSSKQLGYMAGERTTLVGVLGEGNGKSVVTLDPQAHGKAGATGVSSAVPQGAVPFNETGIISITRDAMGQVAAIKFIVDWRVVKLDEKSKQLEAMDGKKVSITHAPFDAGLLPVTSVELIKESSPSLIK